MYIKRNTFTTHDKNQGQSQFVSSSHKLVRLHQTMFCGTANFKHIDHEDPNTGALPASPPAPAPPPVPKGSKKKASKNPYSTRGLDKFSTVLSELESKKERIMSKAGSRGVAMVRFAYSSSRDSWVPIVVRIRDCEERDKQKKTLENVEEEASTTVGVEKTVLDKQEGERVKKGFSWRRYYWALVVVVLILVCLLLYGRVFAICCTTVLWYLVPSTAKENDYRKRVTEGKKRMVGADK